MTTRYKYHFQLQDRALGAFAGPPITGAGGSFFACVDGSPTRAALTDKDGAALTQPYALTRGAATVYSVETSLDLFILCPDQQSVQVYSVGPDELLEVAVDRSRPDQVMVIPLTFADDSADATETATGWSEPAGAVFTSDAAGIKVHTVDATETVDVGTLSSDSGDADGFLSAVSVATLGLVLDNGALYSSLASHLSGSKSITFTFSAGVDTAKLYVFLPYTLLTVGSPTIT